jgi:hypothetical protein
VVDPNAPLVKSFEISLAEGELTRSWDATIVMSPNDPPFLPSSMRKREFPFFFFFLSVWFRFRNQLGKTDWLVAGAFKICDVKSNLQGVRQDQLIFKHKRGTYFTRGYRIFVCQFDIRVFVTPTDLRFELWFAGEKFSGNHEPISVVWDQEGADQERTDQERADQERTGQERISREGIRQDEADQEEVDQGGTDQASTRSRHSWLSRRKSEWSLMSGL